MPDASSLHGIVGIALRRRHRDSLSGEGKELKETTICYEGKTEWQPNNYFVSSKAEHISSTETGQNIVQKHQCSSTSTAATCTQWFTILWGIATTEQKSCDRACKIPRFPSFLRNNQSILICQKPQELPYTSQHRRP